MPNRDPARAIVAASFAALALLLATTASAPCADKPAASHPAPSIERCADEDGAPTKVSKAKARLDPEIVADLIAWIDAKTGWHAHAPPAIRFVPEAQLSKMFAAHSEQPKAVHIDALYSRQNDTIYLPTEWNANDVHDRATLLHELIHHLQVINKVEVTCPNVYEFQSYSLTIDWLRAQGVEKPLKLLHINDVVLFMLSQCPVY